MLSGYFLYIENNDFNIIINYIFLSRRWYCENGRVGLDARRLGNARVVGEMVAVALIYRIETVCV